MNGRYETVQANLINKTIRILSNLEKDFISEITQGTQRKLKRNLSKSRKY